MKTCFSASSTTAARQAALRITFTLLALASCLAGSASAKNIITAASIQRDDVNAAVSKAHDGDIVLIPPGIADWTNYILVRPAITLQFAGIGKSIILDDIVATNNGNPSYTQSAITLWPTNLNVLTRITGLEVRAGTNGRPANSYEKGTFQILGATYNARIDHCLFTNVSNDAIEPYNSACPLVDHCSYYQNKVNANQHFIYIQHHTWGGGTYNYGDGSYEQPATLGTSNAVYVENCDFTGPGGGVYSSCIDSWAGGRWVFRYNTLTNCSIEAHGTESGGVTRSTRSFEIYGNYGTFPSHYLLFTEIRGGSGVVWSNTTFGYNNFVNLNTYRSSIYYQWWGAATGTNNLDLNPPENSVGPAMVLTHAGTNGSMKLVVTNYFDKDFLRGYSIIDMNTPAPFMGPTNQPRYACINFGQIVSNSFANGVTTCLLLPGSGGSTQTLFQNGDQIAFYLPCIIAVDMPGVGQSGVLSRIAKGTSAGQPLNYPTNVVEPIYGWGNTLNGADGLIYAVNPVIKENVHYFNDTVMPGYAPFRYPHPLALTGSWGSLLPPTNLRVVQ
ncbi:MAG TPA: hypothetical protein VHB20_11870 [Verrucomicrobiae bacterium]|jgi:hypothetical protein|nr:hypothetical protein [Verrucomicrobiae bacterium]